MPTEGVLAIFAATYIAMAVGRNPGLRADCKSVALVAATAVITVTGVGPGRAIGWDDLPTQTRRFGVVVLSARFGISDFYEYCADRSLFHSKTAIRHPVSVRELWRVPGS